MLGLRSKTTYFVCRLAKEPMDTDLLKRATDLDDVAKQKAQGESMSYIG